MSVTDPILIPTPTPTLVFVPGVMSDAGFWAPVRAELGVLASGSLVVDHGRADSLVAMARNLLAHTAGPLRLVGHSMGGRVVLEAARQEPARVRGLALLDTGCGALPAGEDGVRETQARLRMVERARRDGMRALAAEWVRGMVHPSRLQDRELIEAVCGMFERHDAGRFAAQMQAMIGRPDAGALLPTLHCPVLVVCGEQDAVSSPEQHRDMARHIAGARFELIADAGHLAPMERPAAVAAALRGWLGAGGP